jgi:hypothetical protein
MPSKYRHHCLNISARLATKSRLLVAALPVIVFDIVSRAIVPVSRILHRYSRPIRIDTGLVRDLLAPMAELLVVVHAEWGLGADVARP